MKVVQNSSGFLLALLSILPAAFANYVWVASTCQGAMTKYSLGCGYRTRSFACQCPSDIYVSSMLKCMHSFLDDSKKIEQALSTWIENCNEIGMGVTYEKLNTAYEKDLASNNFTLTSDLENKTRPLTKPVILTSSEIRISLRSVKTNNWEIYSGTLFG